VVHVPRIDVAQNDDWAAITVYIASARDTISRQYYCVMTETGWKLVSPLHIFTKKWKNRSTKYTSIFYSDSSKINDIACLELDKFVSEVGKRLGLTRIDFDLLEQEKIAYYLCGDKDEIKNITEFEIEGMFMLADDAIVSLHLPHEHELAHFLINYSLRSKPLYTLAFMQEGLACLLGGRWGRSPESILYAGHATMNYELEDLDSILTRSNFNYSAGSDISYPMSALFVGYLLEEVSIERFKKLYHDFSKSEDELNSLTIKNIHSYIEKASGKSWSEFMQKFENYWKGFDYCGITPTRIDLPNSTSNTIASDKFDISVWKQDNKYLFKIHFLDDLSRGVILFDGSNADQVEGYQSRIFGEHLPDTPYIGHRYGLRFARDEVGLYDYYCNKLLAIYTMGFTPSDSYWDAESETITFLLDEPYAKMINLSDITVGATEN
jgi:hypothetical protein